MLILESEGKLIGYYVYNIKIEKYLTSRVGPKVGFTAAFDTRISRLPNLSMVCETLFILIKTHRGQER